LPGDQGRIDLAADFIGALEALNTVTSPVSVSTSTSATVQAWDSVESGSIAPVSESTSLLGFINMPRPEMVLPYLK